MPKCPAIAGRCALHRRADLVDRAQMVATVIGGHQGAVGADAGGVAPAGIDQGGADGQQAAFHQSAERDPRCGPAGFDINQPRVVDRADLRQALSSLHGVAMVALDPDEMPAEPTRHDAGCPGTKERIQDDPAGACRRQDHPVKQGFGFLRRMHLVAVVVAKALRPAADRQQPVAAHLQIVVQALHGLVVEGIAAVGALRCPDQGFVGVGKPRATELGIGFVLRQMTSFKTQKPRSWMAVPTRNTL